jgi:sialic acid synthase SpsE
MRSEIKIRNCIISEKNPVFITAECGVTCNYDIKITKELVDVVSESGADAIKFIFWFPEEIMSDKTVQYSYDTVDGPRTENMFEMLSKLHFTLDQWHEVKAYADSKNVIMFATVNSPSGIAWAEKIGLEAYKLSSWDFNYTPLWRQIAALNKPMLIDTGPVNSLEVSKVMQLMLDAGNDRALLVHCSHAKTDAEFNLRAIPYMRQAFNALVGFSANDRNDEMDYASLALGSVLIEKRLTMSRSLPGHHHVLSKEPREFEVYVKTIRSVQESLGVYDMVPSKNDLAERKKWFRHLVANCDIPAGTLLTADMLEGKRLEEGISPEHIDFFIGRTTKRDLRYNESLTWDCV